MKKKLVLLAIGMSVIIFNTLPNSSLRVQFVGDILLDRGVRTVVEDKGYDYIFDDVKKKFKEGDIVFGNLEGPITEDGFPLPKLFSFQFDEEASSTLKNAGFTVLSLANNHTLDYGREGLLNTIKSLEEANIDTVGAGKNEEEAKELTIIEKKGTKVGFLAYSMFPYEGGLMYHPYGATVNLGRTESIKYEIQDAIAKVDILVVSFHWGKEFTDYPVEYQKTTAYIAIDSGADVVVGHHPHILQGIESYKNRYIFHSIGNFIFDQRMKLRSQSMILEMVIRNKQIEGFNITPIYIDNCKPYVAKGEKKEEIINRIKKLSAILGNDLANAEDITFN